MKIWRNRKTVDLERAYDAIVIGSGISGMTVAFILAREGKRVLVLEQHYTAGGCTHTFHRKGYEWDIGLHYMGEVNRPRSKLLKLFNVLSDNQLKWAPIDDVYNSILIDGRQYDYVSGKERFKAKMKSYFPEEASAIDTYIELVMTASSHARAVLSDKAMPVGRTAKTVNTELQSFFIYSDRTTLEVLNGITSNKELIAVLCGHYGDIMLPPGESSFSIHAMLIRHYIEGASFPIGGAGRIPETIGEALQKRGATLLTSSPVGKIRIDNGATCGVTLDDGTDIDSALVVSTAGLFNTFNKLLPAEYADTGGLRSNVNQLQHADACVVLNVALKGSNDELGLDSKQYWIHPSNDFDAEVNRYRLTGEGVAPFHFISFPSAKDPTWNDRFPGKATVDVASFTSWKIWEKFQDSNWHDRAEEYEEQKNLLANQMWNEVLRLRPQLEGRVAHWELATPLTINHFLARQRGNFMGFAHSPDRFQKSWIRATTPIKGFYVSGQDILADGVSSSLISGVITASAILGRDMLCEMTQLD